MKSLGQEGYSFDFKEQKLSAFVVAPDELSARKYFLAEYPGMDLPEGRKSNCWSPGEVLKEGSITWSTWKIPKEYRIE